MGAISIWKIAIVAVIVILFFGTLKFRTFASDLGKAICGFKKAMSD